MPQKRFIVSLLGDMNSHPKGIVITEEENIEKVKETIQTKLSLQEPITKLFTKFGNQNVEILDSGFIRDGDRILVVTNKEEIEAISGQLERKPFKEDGMVALNIGGEIFFIERDSIRKYAEESMLNKMLTYEEEGKMSAGKYDEKGALIINRNPENFAPILQYLRTGDVIIGKTCDLDSILNEAQYYGIDGVIKKVKERKEYFDQRATNILKDISERIYFTHRIRDLIRDPEADINAKEHLVAAKIIDGLKHIATTDDGFQVMTRLRTILACCHVIRVDISNDPTIALILQDAAELLHEWSIYNGQPSDGQNFLARNWGEHSK